MLMREKDLHRLQMKKFKDHQLLFFFPFMDESGIMRHEIFVRQVGNQQPDIKPSETTMTKAYITTIVKLELESFMCYILDCTIFSCMYAKK